MWCTPRGIAQGPGGEEADNKITVLTALTSTARATNTIWFAAQDTPKPRYQPDTNHPAPAVNAAYNVQSGRGLGRLLQEVAAHLARRQGDALGVGGGDG